MIIVRAAEVARHDVQSARAIHCEGPTMKILYKPFGIVLGLLAGLISQKLFNAVWGIFDKEEPPKPTTEEANWPKVIAAAAVQGLTFRVTRATVDRLGAQGFRYFTGIWPGEKHQEESQASEAVR
jgi:uncharacterized protein DUF4235